MSTSRINLSDVIRGDIFYECEAGVNIKLTAIENCRIVDDSSTLKQGFECCCKKEDGSIVELFETFNAGPYKLKLYETPQYLTGQLLRDMMH